MNLQFLLGSLIFCCSIITFGRAFLRRLTNLTIDIQKPFHQIRLNRDVKSVLCVWLSFLDQYNGKIMFLNERFLSSKTLALYTASVQSIGYGVICNTKWFFGVFPSSWHSFNIPFLGLYPIVLAVNLWGSLWKNHCILFCTDNDSPTFIINRQSSKDTDILKLVRCMVLACLHNNISDKAHQGPKNVLADALSRQKLDKFKQLSPHSSPTPTQVPSYLHQENIIQHCQNCFSHR